jgi:hypothetical protein
LGRGSTTRLGGPNRAEKPILVFAVATLGWGLCAPPLLAENKNSPLAAGIQDNLCLIEEAYNQEAGVVQHISCIERQDQDWFYNFTQEWPFRGQANQLSYTLPYTWLRSSDPNAQGLGDILLNYRRQVLYESDHGPAFAPRLSLILPSGDHDAGLGAGSLGYQVMLPISKIISDRVTLHANAELTAYFDIDGKQPTSYLLGGAFIYAVTRDFNLIVESFGERDQSVGETGRIESEKSYTVSPGARYAFNLSVGQLVLAAGAPILFAESEPDYGAYFYLSIEHRFR